MSKSDPSCPLCQPSDAQVLWQDKRRRIVHVDDAAYPGYCRVIWNQHIQEMTDLTKSQRAHLLNAVYAVEQALRELLSPYKINLASLGNQVPHLHWHVIARFEDDAHFPDPIWAAPKRAGKPRTVNREQLVQSLYARLGGRVRKPR